MAYPNQVACANMRMSRTNLAAPSLVVSIPPRRKVAVVKQRSRIRPEQGIPKQCLLNNLQLSLICIWDKFP
jgi:hypothetical protein